MKRSTNTRRPKSTKAEEAYIRDLKRRSAFDLLRTGEARILTPEEYPEPIKRLRARRRRMLHLTIRPSVMRRLELRSRRTGVPIEEIAAQWIEERSRREAG